MHTVIFLLLLFGFLFSFYLSVCLFHSDLFTHPVYQHNHCHIFYGVPISFYLLFYIYSNYSYAVIHFYILKVSLLSLHSCLIMYLVTQSWTCPSLMRIIINVIRECECSRVDVPKITQEMTFRWTGGLQGNGQWNFFSWPQCWHPLPFLGSSPTPLPSPFSLFQI